MFDYENEHKKVFLLYSNLQKTKKPNSIQPSKEGGSCKLDKPDGMYFIIVKNIQTIIYNFSQTKQEDLNETSMSFYEPNQGTHIPIIFLVNSIP